MEEVKKLSSWDEAKSKELYRKIKKGLVKLSQKETWLFEAGKLAVRNEKKATN